MKNIIISPPIKILALAILILLILEGIIVYVSNNKKVAQEPPRQDDQTFTKEAVQYDEPPILPPPNATPPFDSWDISKITDDKRLFNQSGFPGFIQSIEGSTMTVLEIIPATNDEKSKNGTLYIVQITDKTTIIHRKKIISPKKLVSFIPQKGSLDALKKGLEIFVVPLENEFDNTNFTAGVVTYSD